MIHVKASQRQDTAEGRMLGRMYYGGFLETVLSHGEYSGYPHNGGEHTLYLNMKKEDISSFADVVEETFAKDPGCAGFVLKIRSQLQ